MTSAERLVGWNTLEVLALGAGCAERPVNAIEPRAVAHCQLRFVVGTDWRNLQTILRQHLDAQGFADVAISIGTTCSATRLDLDNPWVDWAMASLQRRPATLLPNLAGRCPTRSLPTPWACPHCGCPTPTRPAPSHAPNEHLLAPVAPRRPGGDGRLVLGPGPGSAGLTFGPDHRAGSRISQRIASIACSTSGDR